MNWVLWREYRLNRWILALGAIALVLPYVYVLTLWGLSVIDSAALSISEAFGLAAWSSLVATQVVLAILGANAIAGERADRSAEFIGYLPVPRTRRLRAKLTLALSLVAVSWGVSALAVGILMLLDPEIVQHPEFSGVVPGAICIAATSLATYALCLLVSSFTTNSAFAVMGGLVTPAVVVFFSIIATASLLGASTVEANAYSLWIAYTIACLAVAGACFWKGTSNYLNQVEP